MHLWMAFVMGNARASLVYRLGATQQACLQWCIGTLCEENGTFVPQAHSGHSRHNMQDEEEVLDAIHANPLTTTCLVTCERTLSPV
jgi:hypothetical protein